MFRNVLLVLAFLLGGILILTPGTFTLEAGLIIMFLGVFLYSLAKKEDEFARARWFAIAFFLLVMVIVASLVKSVSGEPDGYQAELMMRGWAIFVSIIISAPATALFLLLVIYISGVYTLALHESEGISIAEAMRAFFALLIGTNQDWVIVSEGKITKTKEGGLLKKLGGPGKVIVTPGNAVILERTGKITRICGAGVVSTKRPENIRCIFDLRPQYAVKHLENVITADKIPLKIELGIGYTITPAFNQLPPNHPVPLELPYPAGLITDNYGAYPVLEETLRRAAFNNTAGGWNGLAEGAVISNLLDEIMARNLADIFSLDPTNPSVIQRRTVHKIEEDIRERLAGLRNNGVTITGVDIRSITMPKSVEEAVYLELKSDAEARAIASIETQRNRVRGKLMRSFLNSITTQRSQPGGQISQIEMELATTFAKITQRALTDDVLGRQYVEVLERLSNNQGLKSLSFGNSIGHTLSSGEHPHEES